MRNHGLNQLYPAACRAGEIIILVKSIMAYVSKRVDTQDMVSLFLLPCKYGGRRLLSEIKIMWSHPEKVTGRALCAGDKMAVNTR